MNQKRSRYLTPLICNLALKHEKMAFVAGPRQVGKTTLARSILQANGDGYYYNWDDVSFRRVWTKNPALLTRDRKTIVLDELHKAKNWKSTLKGIYDTMSHPTNIIVTGSARLNVYRKGGDSLLGRYFLFRLHPFSVGELAQNTPAPDPVSFLQRAFLESPPQTGLNTTDIFDRLMTFGGFPEPYTRMDHAFSNLWRQGRIEKLVREDLRDISRIPELSQIEMLAALLPIKVGAPASIESLREDLEVSHDTVKRWMAYLEQLYYFFPLKTYSRKLARSIKKERKLYLYDWTEVDDPGARFENCIVSHFLKSSDYWTDSGAGLSEVNYLRNKEKKEVDVLISFKKKPLFTVECKCSDTNLDLGFLSFAKIIGVSHHIQLVASPGIWQLQERNGVKVLVASADLVLSLLP